MRKSNMTCEDVGRTNTDIAGLGVGDNTRLHVLAGPTNLETDCHLFCNPGGHLANFIYMVSITMEVGDWFCFGWEQTSCQSSPLLCCMDKPLEKETESEQSILNFWRSITARQN